MTHPTSAFIAKTIAQIHTLTLRVLIDHYNHDPALRAASQVYMVLCAELAFRERNGTPCGADGTCADRCDGSCPGHHPTDAWRPLQ